MNEKTLSAAGKTPAALPAGYPRSAISQTVSGKLGLAELAKIFTLPWSAYVLLLSVKDGRVTSGRHPTLSAPIVVPPSRQSGGPSLPSRRYTGDWKTMPVSGIVWRSR
ncbi:hypothetical protein CBP34_15335 [Acidovorax carolinensis]|uniref:Uncharacterized protein n=1 Tax=Acidovorax carolinensis TaxID=553814 RepID=A0A240U4L1_9BURK|nr:MULTISPECIES: hypothetical protein [Comamonadaceae]ART52766.1 hypothetical protein CBP34_15335 [Acidovorax carolinensis]